MKPISQVIAAAIFALSATAFAVPSNQEVHIHTQAFELQTVAEGGSDRVPGFKVAEGGSDRIPGFKVAEGGSDRTLGRRQA